MIRSHGEFRALRLDPATDLRRALEQLALRPAAPAMAIVTCCGSLSAARLRPAGADGALELAGPLEILALSGTLSRSGVHLHVAVADAEGATYGGHLLHGCVIYTTAEVVLLELPGMRFSRERDAETGWRELAIRRRSRSARA